MTTKQIQQFNRMRQALIAIHNTFMTSEEFQKKAERLWGVSPEEAIEMAYDNIQSLAGESVKGVKALKSDPFSINGTKKQTV